MKKLPARFQDWVFVFFMTLLMGLCISGMTTAMQTGVGTDFVARWLSAFLRTYIIVVPTVLVVTPLAKRLTGALVDVPSD